MPSKALKGSEPTQVPAAPTFYPSVEEFGDPLAYIAKIRPEAEPFGACKIVPPPGWRPPFALDRRSFKFKTRLQNVHELQERSAAEEQFEEEYTAWLKAANRTWKGPPMVNGREVDIYKLFRLVSKRGGYEKVCESKAWRDVCKVLQVREKSSNAAYAVRQLYQKHLLGYEQQCTQRAEGSKRKSRETSPTARNKLDEMVAAANGTPDMELLGAVAALMEVPATERAANKRLKLDASGAFAREDQRVPGNIQAIVCEMCGGGHNEDKIILCDKCDRGCHTYCLQPPLEDVPEGDWVCPLCIAEEVDSHAFREGKEFSFEQFERMARDFKADWFGGQAAAEKATVEDIERHFWDVVEAGEEPVEVAYGADIDTSRYGSAFPVSRRDGDVTAEEQHAQYAADPWNLNNLPRLDGSLLKHLEDNIAGVTLPWMYVGMMFSSFCWHIEDHMFYSINYNHFGDPKRWYSVPSSAAAAFEAAFRAALPELFEKQPDVLFHLVTMLSPRILQRAEVPVYGLTQGPGEFVVTFPCAYHGGFNTGFNCAEAVNFAPAYWLTFGAAACERLRAFRKPPVVCHEWLLLKVAETGAAGETALRSAQDLRRVVDEETEWRCRLRDTGCFQARRVEAGDSLVAGMKEDPECAFCRCVLHLSAVECKCSPHRWMCLRHAAKLCDCPPAAWRLAYRHSLAELKATAAALSAAAPPALQQEQAEEACAQKCSMEVEEEAAPEPAVEVNEASEEPPQPPESKVIDLRPPVGGANGEALAPIPRRRGRKAGKEARCGRFGDGEADSLAPSVPRLTRAAIKAEEEAQDTMDVLTALTGLADAEPEGEPPAAAVEEAAPQQEEAAMEEDEQQPAPPQPSQPEFDVAGALEDLRAAHKEWLAAAQKVLQHGRARSGDVEALIQRAQQFLWGHEDVQAGVADALSGLRDAQAWAHQVHGFQRNKPAIEEAEAVLARTPHPIAVPGLAKLAEGVRTARAWLQKAATAEQGQPCELRSLESLATEGNRLPVALPQLKALKERVAAARQLVDAVRSALKPVQPPPAAAAAAPAQPPPEAAVRTRRRKKQPEENEEKPAAAVKQPEKEEKPQPEALVVTPDWLKALKAQAGVLRVSFPELEGLTTAAAAVEAFQAKLQAALLVKPTIPQLEALIEEAKGLAAEVPDMQRVHSLVAEAAAWQNRARSASAPRGTLKKMREALHAGLRLGTELPQVEELRGEIRRREWEEHARKALTSKQSASALAEVLEDAVGVGTSDSELAAGLRRRLDSAREWEARAATLLDGPNRPPLAELQSLVAEGGALGVRMERLAAATVAATAAAAWVSRAEHAARSDASPAEHVTLEEIEALLEEYGRLAAALPQASLLASKRDAARQWVERAQAALEQPPSESRAAEYESLLAEGVETGVQTPQQGALRACLDALRWTAELADYRGSCGVPPPVEKAERLLADGEALPVDGGLLDLLRDDLEAVRTWEAGLAEAGLDPEKLLPLAAEAHGMRLRPDSLTGLQEALAAAEAWHQRAERLLVAGTRPQLEEVSAVAAAAAGLPVRGDVTERVGAVLAAGETWRESCRRLWAKRNSGQRLDKCLAIAADGVDAALAQLEPPAEGEERAELYCTCQQPYEADAAMIGCDGCEDWLHCRCVGLTQTAARSLKKYVCPLCLALRGNGRELEQTLARTRRTRRPPEEQLREALAEAEALPCVVSEADELARVLASFARWTAAASAAAGAPEQTGTARLSQLLKSALSVEIGVGEVQQQLMTLLRRENWRERVAAALAPNGRNTVDALEKLEREGESLGLTDDDASAAALGQRLQRLRTWLGAVEEVIAELQQRGEQAEVLAAAIERGRSLLEEGRGNLGLDTAELPRGFDRELARLEEACKLYCLCRQPYNEERPMLGCDHCQEWYHYDCIGLHAPGDDEDDEDVAPEDFRCPRCCLQAGVPYAQQGKLPGRSLQALGLAGPPAEPQPVREASRLHELLAPLQPQANGNGPAAGQQQQPPSHSWLLTVLVQQQRMRPTPSASGGSTAVPQREQTVSGAAAS